MDVNEEIEMLENRLVELRKNQQIYYVKMDGNPMSIYNRRMLPGRKMCWSKEEMKPIYLDRPVLLEVAEVKERKQNERI